MIAHRSQAFTAGELSAVEDFVRGGGGVLAVGLAWSWLQGTGHTLDNFPMNAIAGMFGLRYVDGAITDPTNNMLDPSHPVFHQFYVVTAVNHGRSWTTPPS